MSVYRISRTMMVLISMNLAFALAASGCFSTSQTPRDDVLYSVGGGDVSLRLLDGRERGGELLAVSDSSFTILDDHHVVVALRSAVDRIEFGFTRIDIAAHGLSSQDRETLTRRSRFPYGMSTAALNTLLKDAKQQEPETLRVNRL
jgi:hypothetical protein